MRVTAAALLAVTLVFVAAVAVAGEPAAHPKWRLRWREGWNRHWAGNTGADHGDGQGEVTVVLGAGGRAEVTDEGETRSSTLNHDWYRSTTVKWATAWNGAWSQAGRELRLRLGEVRRADCETIEYETRGRAQPTERKAPCATKSGELDLRCERAQVAVARTDDDDRAPAPASVWSCRPVTAAATERGRPIGTSFPWVLERNGRCLERQSGRPQGDEPRYARCAP